LSVILLPVGEKHMKLKLPERRQFVRIETPLDVEIEGKDDEWTAITRNISPVGLGIESPREITEKEVKLVLHLPMDEDKIKLQGRVIWHTRTSLEDNAPYSAGIEIFEIEERKKTLFLKFLCDLLYDSAYEGRT